VSPKPGGWQSARTAWSVGLDRLRTDTVSWRAIAVAGVLAIALVAISIAQAKRSSAPATPMPPATPVLPVGATGDLVLPGRIQALQETAIYARADGFLKRRLVDVGDRVERGQVLAEIESPMDLEQQLNQAWAGLFQAQAILAQANSNLRQASAVLDHHRAQLVYSRTNLGRWRSLKDRGLVAQQDVDDRHVIVASVQADVNAAQAILDALPATVTAAEANVVTNQVAVQRLLDQQALRQVLAPFPGVITARHTDDGAPVSSAPGGNSAPLFRLAQTDTLKVYVNVPQTYMAFIRPGLTAQLVVRDVPQHVFTARIAQTAATPDPASRTLLTELHLDNEEGLLRLGMYADVKLRRTQE
jgi:multidrug efflux pump subunit AcrA (membrane-fusion protein)